MASSSENAEWYCSLGGVDRGPLTGKALKELAAGGELGAADLVWKTGSALRVAASKVRGLFPTAAAATAGADRSDNPAAREVFISYSSQDKPTADAMCAALERSGMRCWIAPRDIAPGANWGEAIVEGIKVSRVMVVIFFGRLQRLAPGAARSGEGGEQRGSHHSFSHPGHIALEVDGVFPQHAPLARCAVAAPGAAHRKAVAVGARTARCGGRDRRANGRSFAADDFRPGPRGASAPPPVARSRGRHGRNRRDRGFRRQWLVSWRRGPRSVQCRTRRPYAPAPATAHGLHGRVPCRLCAGQFRHRHRRGPRCGGEPQDRNRLGIADQRRLRRNAA